MRHLFRLFMRSQRVPSEVRHRREPQMHRSRLFMCLGIVGPLLYAATAVCAHTFRHRDACNQQL